MSIVEHDYPEDTPVVVIVDCARELPPKPGFTDALRRDALELLAAGKADQAAALVQETVRLDQVATTVTVRPLTAGELATHLAVQAEAAKTHDAYEQELADRATLVENLRAGTATPDEVHAALANLLG